MPPDTAHRPRTPLSDAEARQRAHDALDRAFTHRTVRGQETTGVNLSRFTDALRELDVPIEVRRRERPGPDPSAEAATKSLAAATAADRDDEWVQRVVMVAITAGQLCDVPFPADALDAVLRDFGVRPTLPRTWPTRGEGAIGKHEAAAPAVAAAVRKETGQGLVTVVVGGHRIDVEWHPDDEHAALIERALRIAGVAAPREGEPWRWWQLRDEAGALLDPARNCGLDFDASETLFLDPYAGGGAAVDVTRSLAHGDGWVGTMPARGTRRRLIYDTLLHTRVKLADGIAREPVLLDRDGGVQVLADAIESSLLQATIAEEAMARGAEALTDGIENVVLEPGEGPATNLLFSERQLWGRAQDSTVFDVLNRLSRERVERKAVESALDCAHIPLAAFLLDCVKELARRLDVAERALTGRPGELRIVLEDVTPEGGPPEYRFVEVEDGEGRSVALPIRRSVAPPLREIVIPADELVLSAQALLTAAQRLPEEQYRLLERALAWDVEDIGAVPEEDVKPESIALTERSGRRIAKAVETLTVSAGGALRELLDRTATDRGRS